VTGLFTVKVIRPLLPGNTPNELGQVLFVIVTTSVANVEIVTGPLAALINGMLGNTPSI